MAMLSNLLHYTLVDQQGRAARLVDFAVDLSAGEYPPVTHVLFRGPHRVLMQAVWQPARAADRRARRLDVNDLGQATPVEPEWYQDAVLLARDIMDALVLDLEDHLALRANDLWLEERGDQFLLSGVDVSLRAILRRTMSRLPRGLFRGRLRDWRVIEFLRGDPAAARAGRDYHGLIERLPAGEIANLADSLPYLHAAELVTLLPDIRAADTLESMMPERQLQVFEELADEQGERLLALMRPDIVADLLGRLQPERARYWLEHMPRSQYRRVLELLRYPDNTAGGIMTNDMMLLPAELTVSEALAELRSQLSLPAFINFIQIVYIVDSLAGQRLRGTVSLRDLLVADESQRLEQIMNPYIVTLHPLQSAAQAAYQVIDHELAALPVVGETGKIVGIVTVDAALVLAAPPGWANREAPRMFA